MMSVQQPQPMGMEAAGRGPKECRFSPYIDNGGTAIGISGKDFSVLVGDTRCSMGFNIQTRHSSRLTQLTSKCVIASGGMQAERETLHRILKMRIAQYKHAHRKEPTTNAVAAMLSTILYYKRFFPYYTFNIVAGVDEEGKGAVYSYDAIGSYDRVDYTSTGSGSGLIYPVLDCALKGEHRLNVPTEDMSKLDAVDLAKDAISGATERDIYTGDSAEVAIIDSTGVTIEMLELRKD